jgi:hypothetical protein
MQREAIAQREAAAQAEAQLKEAARLQAARIETARLQAEREQAARQAAAQLEEQRRQAALEQAARLETARLEAERQEAARQAAARLEAQRREVARQEEAARLQTARLEAERRDAALQAAARPEAPRIDAKQDEEARREAKLRAIGRQLDEEAARREAAATPSRQANNLPLSLSTARRVRLWGRTDRNLELVEYAEAWARRIQFNTTAEMVGEIVKRSHTPPMVTVAIRSDGSIESVTFFVSSGVAEIDALIRRILETHRPYQVFSPALARDFDVIEIRRTWHFDPAVRLY